jgi:hypothetical protein
MIRESREDWLSFVLKSLSKNPFLPPIVSELISGRIIVEQLSKVVVIGIGDVGASCPIGTTRISTGPPFFGNFPLRHPSRSWYQIIKTITPEWDDRLGVDVVNVGEGRGEKDRGVDWTGNLM